MTPSPWLRELARLLIEAQRAMFAAHDAARTVVTGTEARTARTPRPVPKAADR